MSDESEYEVSDRSDKGMASEDNAVSSQDLSKDRHQEDGGTNDWDEDEEDAEDGRVQSRQYVRHLLKRTAHNSECILWDRDRDVKADGTFDWQNAVTEDLNVSMFKLGFLTHGYDMVIKFAKGPPQSAFRLRMHLNNALLFLFRL